jgi:hypothetical protein
MKIRSWLALGGFAVISMAACSSTPDAVKYPSVDSFCSEKANQECQVAAKCAATMDSCVSARKAQCASDAAAASSSGSSRQYRAANAQACVDKTHDSFSKDGTISPTDLKTLRETCGRVFTGSQKALQACVSDFDCEGSMICSKLLCAMPSSKSKGAGCASAGDQCEAGSFCNEAGAASVCLAKKASGESCSMTAPCLEDLRCNNVCGPRFASGVACATDDDCASSAPYCDPAINNKCDAGLIFAPGAAACKANMVSGDRGFGG